MIVLGLDTTGAHCSVAIVDEARILARISENIGRGHAERLAPMVNEALEQAGLKPADIDKLAVCTGPGSFTGLRVALAFAKGFALPRNLPVIGLSSLAIWAAQSDPEAVKKIAVISDVRRGELCWAAIFKGEVVQAPITEKADIARQNISRLKPAIVLEDPPLLASVLAWLAVELDPADYPAAPLYSRPPDAKLPGGLEPA